MGLIVTILVKLFGEQAKMFAIPIMIGLAGLAWFVFSQHYVGVGKDKIRAQIAEKVAEARALEQERFLDRIDANAKTYNAALTAALEARNTAPQIIREIRNAPATICSAEPIGIERVRLLNAAIAGYRNQNPAAGRTVG